MLYNLVVAPIEAAIEFVFAAMTDRFSELGLGGAIFAVSVAVNFLALPIYNIADAIQAKEREIQARLQAGLSHIKKTFSGDERYMMARVFYRQNNYSPIFALRSSLSILIEIPFFIAAYHFLSNCEMLRGERLWFLRDLGEPDAAFSVGNFCINILPILMTAINCASAAIYTKGFPAKEKIQTFALAAIFLALLYNSPSGLVFYWILNNLFSLCKNIVLKTKRPALVVHVFLSASLIFLTAFIFLNESGLQKSFYASFAAIAVGFCTIPLWIPAAKRIFSLKSAGFCDEKLFFRLFLACSLFEWAFIGLFLPSKLIASSPVEFSFIGTNENPIFFVKSAAVFYFGLFTFWQTLIFKMISPKARRIFALFHAVAAALIALNATVFASDYGTLDAFCTMSSDFALRDFSVKTVLIPFLAFLAVSAAAKISFASRRRLSFLTAAFGVLAAASLGISAAMCAKIEREFEKYKISRTETLDSSEKISPEIHLSKTEKNVIFIFLDRAFGPCVPYIFEKRPEIARQFSGFECFENCASFASHTTRGAPPLFGGYEYTPEAMNARPSELLRRKHDESLLVLPRIFSDAGFSVSVFDPPLPNYSWKGDLSSFKSAGFFAAELAGKYSVLCRQDFSDRLDDGDISIPCAKRIKAFSLMQVLPPPARFVYYLKGKYCQVEQNFSLNLTEYLAEYSTLHYLPRLADFSESKAAFAIICNDTLHKTDVFLNDDDFMPDVSHSAEAKPEWYKNHVAVLKRLGAFFDLLRENGVYDSTRIVIASDHASNSYGDFDDFSVSIPKEFREYCPLLMSKDFGKKGEPALNFEFMTNADAVSLLVRGIAKEENPFTGKAFSDEAKNAGVTAWRRLDESVPSAIYNKKTFNLSQPDVFISESIYEKSNWKRLSK